MIKMNMLVMFSSCNAIFGVYVGGGDGRRDVDVGPSSFFLLSGEGCPILGEPAAAAKAAE